jgi:ketosteroid isomerase-like protein
MYKTIVRARVAHLLSEANKGNWQIIVDELAERFTYRFVGDTPLGGTRTSKPAMQAWFQRLYRLFPNFRFEPHTIIVSGPPWHTTVMTYVKIHGTQPAVGGGTTAYENEFMQRIEIKWGKITSVLTLEDTQRFVNLLPKLAEAGFKDATAAMIEG